jgi:hypothetical protein
VAQEREEPARLEQARGLAPADRRVDPVEGRRREHAGVGRFREVDVLEARDMEADQRRPADTATGDLDHPAARVDGIDLQAARCEQLGQLARAAADLDHPGPGAQRSSRRRSVDERVRVPAADVVVGLSHAVEDLSPSVIRLGRGHDRSVRGPGCTRPF